MRAGGGRAVLLLTLALGACRSRPADSAAPAEDAGGPVSNAALPGCEVLLPADLRELTLPGFTLKEERMCPTCGPLCTFRSDTEKDVSVSVAWDCHPRYARTDVSTLLEPTLKAGGEQVPALGRAAARRAPAQGMVQVMAWDDDTPCALVVTSLGGDAERALDVARTALTTTTPAALVPPPPAADSP